MTTMSELLSSAPERFPEEASSFALPGPAGKLEVAIEIADRASARAGTVVICHPHPLQGGTMHNKVVTMAGRALRETGLDTVRFNFRGVGESTGSYDEGHGESDDLEAVVAWVRRLRPHEELWLAGFSFGSYIALKNAVRLRADALISIAPPVGRWDFADIAIPTCPWLIVQGEEDEVVDPAGVFAWVESLEVEPTLVRMPETSHFFHRRLMDLRGAIKHATLDWLPAARGA
jgi:alpha/beta superfamily hydrolase